MPLYDYKCELCGKEQEVFHKMNEEAPSCNACNGHLKKLIQTPKVRLFRAGVYEHIAYEPIEINSMKQLKAECKKHGVTSAYVEDIC